MSVQARIVILYSLEVLGFRINDRARLNTKESADADDAILCALAGMDFLKGDAHPPEKSELVAKGPIRFLKTSRNMRRFCQTFWTFQQTFWSFCETFRTF